MALPGQPERYRFGRFELQPDKRRLGGEGFLALEAEQKNLTVGGLT
jgi:hypothetical protein